MDCTPRDVINAAIANFGGIAHKLGFERYKKDPHRCRCTLCEGSDPRTFRYTDDGRWFCHRCTAGGGVLDLVQAVIGCDRRDALRWLADHLGLWLSDRQWALAERRDFARRRRRAEVVAAKLADQREERLKALRRLRNCLWDDDAALCRIAQQLPEDDSGWDWIWRHALDYLEAEAIEREIARLEAAPLTEEIADRRAAA